MQEIDEIFAHPDADPWKPWTVVRVARELPHRKAGERRLHDVESSSVGRPGQTLSSRDEKEKEKAESGGEMRHIEDARRNSDSDGTV